MLDINVSGLIAFALINSFFLTVSIEVNVSDFFFFLDNFILNVGLLVLLLMLLLFYLGGN